MDPVPRRKGIGNMRSNVVCVCVCMCLCMFVCVCVACACVCMNVCVSLGYHQHLQVFLVNCFWPLGQLEILKHFGPIFRDIHVCKARACTVVWKYAGFICPLGTFACVLGFKVIVIWLVGSAVMKTWAGTPMGHCHRTPVCRIWMVAVRSRHVPSTLNGISRLRLCLYNILWASRVGEALLLC